MARLKRGAPVVLGGSFLGMEVAFSLLKRGLQVTIIEQESLLLTHLEAPDLSAYFQRYAESHGMSVLLNDTAAAVHGEGRVREVQTIAGHRVPCDLLVVCTGVGPASDFLAGSGIALERGWVLVNSLLRTSAANVFAAGDITVFYDPLFARSRHIEHWDNAVKQGRLAAKNMLGRRLPYDEVSYFYCEFGDVRFNVLGATDEGEERIARGSMDARSCSVFYLKGDVARAFFSTGRPADETRAAEGLIRYRVNLHAIKDRLSEPTFSLDRIPAQTALIPSGWRRARRIRMRDRQGSRGGADLPRYRCRGLDRSLQRCDHRQQPSECDPGPRSVLERTCGRHPARADLG